MTENSSIDTGIIIRRTLFLIVLVLLTAANLFAVFKGLNSPQAMDQAQIAREIARGNGFTTKVIRPVAFYQASKGWKEHVDYTKFEDTYHSPLNPFINAAVLRLIGANDSNAWQMQDKELVFPLDRVIATVSTLFFLMAIGVNYLLVSRIFDAKIAGVTAILLLFSQTMWDFSLSGLPQMLLLFLFSGANFFTYRAIEAQSEGRFPLVPALIAGAFFVLMALTHWMSIWVALGYIIFAAIYFKPRGIIGIAVIVLIAAAAAGPMLRNQRITGSPFGTAFLTLYNGLGDGTEDTVMRSADLADRPLSLDGLVMKVVRTTLLQTTDIIPLLAGIVVAPLFFLALMHPFKRAPIAHFRWVLLVMWVTTAVGLSFYGVSTKDQDPNQLHLLFAPLMSAYGLAFLSILWSRITFVAENSLLKNVHLIAAVFICALPMIIATPRQIINGMSLGDRGGIPHWPPYYSPALNLGVKTWTNEKQIIMADQPWAVAWYADRMSIWLPPTRKGFERLENVAADSQTPVAGILISPVSNGLGSIAEINRRYQDFTSLVIDGRVYSAMEPADPITSRIFNKDPKTEAVMKRFPYWVPLVGMDMIYYSDRALRSNNEGGGQ